MSSIDVFPSTEELGITGRQERLVYECLADGAGHTFDDIRSYMRMADCLACSTGISARIRDINRRLYGRRLRVRHRPVSKGSNHMVYRLEAAQ